MSDFKFKPKDMVKYGEQKLRVIKKYASLDGKNYYIVKDDSIDTSYILPEDSLTKAKKFNTGDYVIALPEASDEYSVTQEGYVGRVMKCKYTFMLDEDQFCISKPNGFGTFIVNEKYFRLATEAEIAAYKSQQETSECSDKPKKKELSDKGKEIVALIQEQDKDFTDEDFLAIEERYLAAYKAYKEYLDYLANQNIEVAEASFGASEKAFKNARTQFFAKLVKKLFE